ncbi:MAG TPA: electron transfer flavoprotein subunit alpha/FixB family protein [Solirubrobacteraceae bacterium]|jgi:electron transfer flavoprotein alpha subunit
MGGEVLVLIEHADAEADELSLQALALARAYARTLGDAPLAAVLIGAEGREAAASLGVHGVARVHIASHPALDGPAPFAPDAWAAAISDLIEQLEPAAVLAAASDRGNEILARVAARADLPMAANCTRASASPEEPTVVTRLRWGGSLLEEAAVEGSPVLLTVAAHAVAAETVAEATLASVEEFTPAIGERDLRVRVLERVADSGGGVSLADARVVVSGGRGVGSTEGFAVIEELAALLGAAVGCSRAVTMAGWRPHSDQVGQTGTKIAPDLYIPCGISGATQHMAGCKGAKRLLAVNPDAEAPIFASADYAVIGDLHEVVPAISAAIRSAREAR